jgi:hypothetical protein
MSRSAMSKGSQLGASLAAVEEQASKIPPNFFLFREKR